MPRRKGGATSANLNLTESSDNTPVRQELGDPGASISMLLPALLHYTEEFTAKGKQRAPAVRNHFKQMLDLYEAASPEARAELDKVGGPSLEGFNAWASQGMGERGDRAMEWANMVSNLPMFNMPFLRGGRREVEFDSPVYQATSQRLEDNYWQVEKDIADKVGVPFEEWKNMSKEEQFRRRMDRAKADGLRKFGLPQLVDGMIDVVGNIPGFKPFSKFAHRMVGVMPGTQAWDPNKKSGWAGLVDAGKDFVTKDLPGIAIDYATKGRGRKRSGRGLPLAPKPKPYNLMTAEERQMIPFEKIKRAADEAAIKRESRYMMENQRALQAPNTSDKEAFRRITDSYTEAKPENNFEMPGDIAKYNSYEDMLTKYQMSGREAQAQERPDLKFGSREQKQDLVRRQDAAKRDAALEKLAKEKTGKRAALLKQEAVYDKMRQGGSSCDACGSAAPSAGFLRKVLGKYSGSR